MFSFFVISGITAMEILTNSCGGMCSFFGRTADSFTLAGVLSTGTEEELSLLVVAMMRVAEMTRKEANGWRFVTDDRRWWRIVVEYLVGIDLISTIIYGRRSEICQISVWLLALLLLTLIAPQKYIVEVYLPTSLFVGGCGEIYG